MFNIFISLLAVGAIASIAFYRGEVFSWYQIINLSILLGIFYCIDDIKNKIK